MAKRPRKIARRNTPPQPEGKPEQVARAMILLAEHYGSCVVIVPASDDDGAQGYEVMSAGDTVMSLGLAAAFRGSA